MQKNPYTRSLTKQNAVLVCAIALAVALLDGVLKYFALQIFPSDHDDLAWPFALALHKNPGIIFDIPVPLIIILPLTIMICAALVAQARKWWKVAPERSAALITMTIGALGNAIDRFVNGFTTDYLIFFGRSAINIADILIITGAIGYLYYSSRRLPEDMER